MHIPRSRGAVTGLLLVILGLWGGFIPFVGQYFDYTVGSASTWDFTWGRFWLSILPAAAVFSGGLMLLFAARRPSAVFGAWMAFVGGVWFVIGPTVSMAWNDGVSAAGLPVGSTSMRLFELLGYFYALGALVTTLSAFALGRLSLRSARDVEVERERARRRDAAATERRFRHEPERHPVGAAAVGGGRTRVEPMGDDTAHTEPVAGDTARTERVAPAEPMTTAEEQRAADPVPPPEPLAHRRGLLDRLRGR